MQNLLIQKILKIFQYFIAKSASKQPRTSRSKFADISYLPPQPQGPFSTAPATTSPASSAARPGRRARPPGPSGSSRPPGAGGWVKIELEIKSKIQSKMKYISGIIMMKTNGIVKVRAVFQNF